MARFRALMLAGAIASLWTFSIPAESLAQAAGVVPQPAEGTKAPPPPSPQPGAVVGSAADAPAVAAQADSQPVMTPAEDAKPIPSQPSQAQAPVIEKSWILPRYSEAIPPMTSRTPETPTIR